MGWSGVRAVRQHLRLALVHIRVWGPGSEKRYRTETTVKKEAEGDCYEKNNTDKTEKVGILLLWF